MVGLKLASVNYPGDRKAESVNGFTGRLAYQLFSRLMKDYGLLRIWTLEGKVNFPNSYTFLSICRIWLHKEFPAVRIWYFICTWEMIYSPGLLVGYERAGGSCQSAFQAVLQVGLPIVRGGGGPFWKVHQIFWPPEAPCRCLQGGGYYIWPSWLEWAGHSLLWVWILDWFAGLNRFWAMTTKDNSYSEGDLLFFVNFSYVSLDVSEG